MSVSVGKIADQVNTKILEGGQNFIDAARLVGSVEALESRFSVANIAALPLAADNTGRFVYVEDIESYRYSDGTQWTNDYDTTLTEGQLWAWGFNVRGQLGDGTLTDKCSPVREICSATDWCQVAAGRCHSIAVKTSGELWAWGSGFCGALGAGTTACRCSPVREICSATDWCQASTNFHTSLAIKTTGELWAWGRNPTATIGDGTVTDKCSPVREFCSATDWCQVSSGLSHAAAVKTSGELWAWGSNTIGTLGDGTKTDKCSPVREFCSATDWCQVSAGGAHTSAVKTSGELWAWGCGNCGQLGDGILACRCSPVREFCSATNWCQVSAGNRFSSAIKTSGELWAWGRGSCGLLGDGTTATSCSPVREFYSATDWHQTSAGYGHTAAVKTSGELWSWGYNARGSLGDGTTTNRCSPVREICSATDWCQVSTTGTVAAGGTVAIKIIKGFNEP